MNIICCTRSFCIFRRAIYLIIFLSCQVTLFSQTVVTGTVIDRSTKKPIPFASIGIKGTVYGTVCDENGIFNLNIKTYTEKDTIKIAAIGYQSKSSAMANIVSLNNSVTELSASAVQLHEVVIKPGKTIRKVLGNKKYNTNISCNFTGVEGNYKGAEAAIKANNKKDRLVWLEDFNFYLMKNAFADSVTFRLNFYTVSAEGLPQENILKKPVIFKTAVKRGIVKVDLIPHNISITGDFFMSLECLEDNMQKEMLSFSGSISGPSFFKVATFGPWYRPPVMGLDFNVTVSYRK
jgi:hypothetical protein